MKLRANFVIHAAILIMCAEILLCSVASMSHAEEWQTGETRRVSADYIVDGTNYPVIKGTFHFSSEALDSSNKTFDATAVFSTRTAFC